MRALYVSTRGWKLLLYWHMMYIKCSVIEGVGLGTSSFRSSHPSSAFQLHVVEKTIAYPLLCNMKRLGNKNGQVFFHAKGLFFNACSLGFEDPYRAVGQTRLLSSGFCLRFASECEIFCVLCFCVYAFTHCYFTRLNLKKMGPL